MKAFFRMLVVLLFAAPVFADTVSFNNGNEIIVYPDGVTVTSEQVVPTEALGGEYGLVDFTFCDGSGYAEGNIMDGDGGVLDFTTPVTSLTISWIIVGAEPPPGALPMTTWVSWATDSSGDVFDEYSCGADCPASATMTFTGDISSFTWAAPTDGIGWGGIESMSYVEDQPVPTPEPGTIALLIVGLAALGALIYRRSWSEHVSLH